MEQLGIPYFYERQCIKYPTWQGITNAFNILLSFFALLGIITKAMDIPDVDSICSFCSRLKRKFCFWSNVCKYTSFLF
jgi:hypothetical protein